MKKLITIAFAAAASATVVLYAGSDRIDITGKSGRVSKLWIDDIKELTVSQSPEVAGGGYDVLNAVGTDGTVTSVSIDDIQKMVWVGGRLELPVSLTVDPHQYCATFHVASSDPSLLYRVGALPMSVFEGVSEREYDDIILDYETQLLEAQAASVGYKLTDYTTEDVFLWSGDNVATWWPLTVEEELAMPGKPYMAYVYAGEITSDGLVFKYDVMKVPFTAKEKKVEDVAFTISAELASNAMTTTVSCADPDMPFVISFCTPEEVEDADLDWLAEQKISTIESVIFGYGGDGDWDRVTYRGEGSATKQRLCPGDEIYVIAFGCEWGAQTSHVVVSEKYVIPQPTVVDDCTFNVNASEITASEINLNIVPSNASTKYVAFVSETASLPENISLYVDQQLYYKTISNQIIWANGTDDPHIFSGTQNLSSKDDVIEGKYLTAATEYTFLICGVNDEGVRTTDITEFGYTPEASQQTVSFNVTFGEFAKPWAWQHTQAITVTPSDPNAKYVCDKLRKTDALMAKDDDAFIRYYIDSYGSNLPPLKSGEYNGSFAFSNNGSWDKYLIFIFGYDGGATSDLYLYEIDTETGEITPLRGPDANQ